MKTTGLWFRGKGESSYLCRYAAAWEQLSQNDFVGVVCGQISSDRQDMMRFIVKTGDQGAVKYLILENVETISGRAVNFDKLDPRIQSAASSSKQCLLDLHDEMEWDIGRRLVLRDSTIGQLSPRSLNTLVLGDAPSGQLIEQVFTAAKISISILEDSVQQTVTPSWCPSCHASIQAGAKFCPECGTKLQQSCDSCGAALISGAKFCAECGAKVGQKVGAGETGPLVINKCDSPYLLTILVNDEGVSYEITLNGDQCSWEDNLRNELSLGAQYIITKMLDDIECEVGEWSSHQLEQFYSDRSKELAVLKSSQFISDCIQFNFRDERTQSDGTNQAGSNVGQSIEGTIIDARVGILRSDWNIDEYGDEISFWSRGDDPQIFSINGNPAPDGGLDSYVVTILKNDKFVVVSLCDSEGRNTLQQFSLENGDDDFDSFGGARGFLSNAFASVTNDATLADDLAWLILNNGSHDMESGDWSNIVDSNWFGEVGGGDQLHVSDDAYAGGVFVEVVSFPDVTASVSDNMIEYDPELDKDESTKFVAVGTKETGSIDSDADSEDISEDDDCVIGQDTVVTISKVVSDRAGNVVDDDSDPLIYLHGRYAGIFERIEEALDGKRVGDTLTVKLSAAEAFGSRDESLVDIVRRSEFPNEPEIGMTYEAQDDADGTNVRRVIAISGDKVTLDANHPLAGLDLIFTCTVLDVRSATDEEVEKGEPD